MVCCFVLCVHRRDIFGVFMLFSYLLRPQHVVAMIAEMIHVASLVHDDVIDASNTRRGVDSIHKKWGQRKVSLGSTIALKYCMLDMLIICIYFVLFQIRWDKHRGIYTFNLPHNLSVSVLQQIINGSVSYLLYAKHSI